MKYLVMFFFIFTTYLCNEMIMSDNYRNIVAHQRVKDALDRATHDASLQATIDKSGSVHFDWAKVESTFKESLSKNLYLETSTLTPLGNNLLRHPIVIKTLVSVETVPYDLTTGITATPTIHITKPSVVAIVEFTLPQRVGGTESFKSMIGSIHEYK